MDSCQVVCLIDTTLGQTSKNDNVDEKEIHKNLLKKSIIKLLTHLSNRAHGSSKNFKWGFKFFNRSCNDSRKVSNQTHFRAYDEENFNAFESQLEEYFVVPNQNELTAEITNDKFGKDDNFASFKDLKQVLKEIIYEFQWDSPDIQSPVKKTRHTRGGVSTETSKQNFLFIFSSCPLTALGVNSTEGSSDQEKKNALAQNVLPSAVRKQFIDVCNIKPVIVHCASGSDLVGAGFIDDVFKILGGKVLPMDALLEMGTTPTSLLPELFKEQADAMEKNCEKEMDNVKDDLGIIDSGLSSLDLKQYYGENDKELVTYASMPQSEVVLVHQIGFSKKNLLKVQLQSLNTMPNASQTVMPSADKEGKQTSFVIRGSINRSEIPIQSMNAELVLTVAPVIDANEPNSLGNFQKLMMDLSQKMHCLIVECRSSSKDLYNLGILQPLTPCMATFTYIKSSALIETEKLLEFKQIPKKSISKPPSCEEFIAKTLKTLAPSSKSEENIDLETKHKDERKRHRSSSKRKDGSKSSHHAKNSDEKERERRRKLKEIYKKKKLEKEQFLKDAAKRHSEKNLTSLKEKPLRKSPRKSPRKAAMKSPRKQVAPSLRKSPRKQAVMSPRKSPRKQTLLSPRKSPRKQPKMQYYPVRQSPRKKTSRGDCDRSRKSTSLVRHKSTSSIRGRRDSRFAAPPTQSGRAEKLLNRSKQVVAVQKSKEDKIEEVKASGSLPRKNSNTNETVLTEFQDIKELLMHVTKSYENVLVGETEALNSAQSVVNTTLHFMKSKEEENPEVKTKEILIQNLLLSNNTLREKYKNSSDDQSKLLEYQLQILLHLEIESLTNIKDREINKNKTIENEEDEEEEDENVQEIAMMLRAMSFIKDANFLSKYLSEVLLENYQEIIPKFLGGIYDELLQPVPKSLSLILSPGSKEEEETDPSPLKEIPNMEKPKDTLQDETESSTKSKNPSRGTKLAHFKSFDVSVKRQISVPGFRKPKNDSKVKARNSAKKSAPQKPNKGRRTETQKVRRNLFMSELQDESSTKAKLARRQSVAVMESSKSTPVTPKKGVLKPRLPRTPKSHQVGRTKTVIETPAHKQLSKMKWRRQEHKRKRTNTQQDVMVIDESPEKPLVTKLTDPKKKSSVSLKRRASFYSVGQNSRSRNVEKMEQKYDLLEQRLTSRRLFGDGKPDDQDNNTSPPRRIQPTFLFTSLLGSPSPPKQLPKRHFKALFPSPSKNDPKNELTPKEQVEAFFGSPVKSVKMSPLVGGQGQQFASPKKSAFVSPTLQSTVKSPLKSPLKDTAVLPSTPKRQILMSPTSRPTMPLTFTFPKTTNSQKNTEAFSILGYEQMQKTPNRACRSQRKLFSGTTEVCPLAEGSKTMPPSMTMNSTFAGRIAKLESRMKASVKLKFDENPTSSSESKQLANELHAESDKIDVIENEPELATINKDYKTLSPNKNVNVLTTNDANEGRKTPEQTSQTFNEQTTPPSGSRNVKLKTPESFDKWHRRKPRPLVALPGGKNEDLVSVLPADEEKIKGVFGDKIPDEISPRARRRMLRKLQEEQASNEKQISSDKENNKLLDRVDVLQEKSEKEEPKRLTRFGRASSKRKLSVSPELKEEPVETTSKRRRMLRNTSRSLGFGSNASDEQSMDYFTNEEIFLGSVNDDNIIPASPRRSLRRTRSSYQDSDSNHSFPTAGSGKNAVKKSRILSSKSNFSSTEWVPSPIFPGLINESSMDKFSSKSCSSPVFKKHGSYYSENKNENESVKGAGPTTQQQSPKVFKRHFSSVSGSPCNSEGTKSPTQYSPNVTAKSLAHLISSPLINENKRKRISLRSSIAKQ